MVEMGCLLINLLAASRIMLMMTSCFGKRIIVFRDYYTVTKTFVSQFYSKMYLYRFLSFKLPFFQFFRFIISSQMLETVVKRRVITLLANMDFGLSHSFFKTRIFETTTDSLVDLQLHFGPDYTPILEQYSKFVSLLEELD